MTVDSTAYNISQYVADAVMLSALAIDDCLELLNDTEMCKHKLSDYILNTTTSAVKQIVHLQQVKFNCIGWYDI